MKVALIHDWLTGMRGGEKVLEVFCELFPQAEIFTLIHKKGSVSSVIEARPIHTSFLQKMPNVFKNYRNYLPLFPAAIKQFDLRGFDVIISSSHCVAKGVKRPKGVPHYCYCYTPIRYLWVFFDQYFGGYPAWKKFLVRLIGERIKKWDRATASGVDEFIAISQTIQARIKEVYKRTSTVIYPPVDVDAFLYDPSAQKGDYYLCVSAFVPYKRIDLIIDSFNRMKDKKLVLVGDGDIRQALEKRAKSDTIDFRGWVPHNELLALYQGAKAFLYAAQEDFGIAPVEAQAVGVPVIAYGKGGVSETVIPLTDSLPEVEPTGVLFYEQHPQALVEAIGVFEKNEERFNPLHARGNALKFSRGTFTDIIRRYFQQRLRAFTS